MDILCCHFCAYRALWLLVIWSIISFNSKGDSDPLVLSLKKESSYPKIIGCVPCSHEILMGSYFDTHKSLSDPDFRIFLDQETRSSDFCERMIHNIEIFGLSSLQRDLIGEGSHRKLITTMIFNDHPEFTHFVDDHFCEAVVVEYLPAGVFSDPFELQHLVGRKVFRDASVLGDTNLELPSALSSRSVVEIHSDAMNGTHKVVVQLPLHARYPLLDYRGYVNININEPDLLLRCRPKEDSELNACSWTLIDMGIFNGSSVAAWRTPCGNEAHAMAVTIITYLSALVCSLLIVLSSAFFSQKETNIA
ncbi:hypothetical protein KSP39_PZI014739 [Platanthera zijinensis]|uniref:Phosphatidylinositol-glycan biosynthesis class X protein n=1 Tax=Platanthera zijinensis TaxID=2320716 RepID=A0AAP0BAD3_9ASPA